MNKSKILIILLFVMILSISAVNGENIADDSILQNIDSGADDSISSFSADFVNSQSNDAEMLISDEENGDLANNDPNDINNIDCKNGKMDVSNLNVLRDTPDEDIKGTFTDLKQQISNAGEGTLDLEYDFAYSETIDSEDEDLATGIYIEDPITINGRGHKIDGKNLARIFYFDLYGCEVHLNNMTLINGFADSDNAYGSGYGNGGSVYIDEDSTLYFENVKFYYNHASACGGAIYSEGEVYIENCEFNGNYVAFPVSNSEDGGAAIYHYGDFLSIIGSNITNHLNEIDRIDGDEENYLTGAVVTYSSTIIENSYFSNNTGSLGGAISSFGYFDYGNCILTVKNTSFEGNEATFGGAIYAKSFNINVDNCTFENNNATGNKGFGDKIQGGAIVMVPGYFSATITNSIFNQNNAEDFGGAISLDNVGDDTIIDKCTFNENSANEGGALYVLSGSSSIIISNSSFSDNVASLGNAIANDGTLELYNNTISKVSADIYIDRGDIDSILKIKIFDNQTISAEVGDVLLLNATFTDDNGNLIYDSYFRFYINNKTIEDVSFDNGVYSYEYTVDSPGEKVISSIFYYDYDYGETERLISIVNVPKIDLTNFNISCNNEEVSYGSDFVVYFTLNYDGEFGSSEIINLVINDTEQDMTVFEENVTVINGNNSFTITSLLPGSYSALALINDGNFFNDANSNMIYFTIGKANSTVIINADDINYHETANILVNVSCVDGGVAPAGTMNVTISGKNGIVKSLTDVPFVGNAISEVISHLPSGNYTVSVSYSGDGNYNGTAGTRIFSVNKIKATIEIGTRDIAYGNAENVSATIPEDASGAANIVLSGDNGFTKTFADVPFAGNVLTKIISGLPVGNYNLTVNYLGDVNYNETEGTAKFSVIKTNPTIDLDTKYVVDGSGKTIIANLPEDATGFLSVKIDGHLYANKSVKGSTIITVPKLSQGVHIIAVNYTGDHNYDSFYKSFTLSIKIKAPVVKLSNHKSITVIYSSKASYKVLLTLDNKIAAGKTVIIRFNGKKYNVVTDSKGYATLRINTKIKPKKYIITSIYDNFKVTDKITVMHIIKAYNKKAVRTKNLKIFVKLKKVNGKFVKGKKIKLIFKGKKYFAKTNKKGVAKFTINKKVLSKLKKGKSYKFTVSYGKDKLIRKIFIRK